MRKETPRVVPMSYTAAVRVRYLFGLLLALMVAGGLASAPAGASTYLSNSSELHREAAHGAAAGLAAQRAPGQPAPCLERHHSCGPDAILPATGRAPQLDFPRRASRVIERAPLQSRASDLTPHPAAPLSILFRNFRK